MWGIQYVGSGYLLPRARDHRTPYYKNSTQLCWRIRSMLRFSTVAGSSGRHPIAIQWAGYRRPPFKGKCPINYCLPQIPSPVLQPLWQNVYPWWISQETQTSKTQTFFFSNNIMFSYHSEKIHIYDGLFPFSDFESFPMSNWALLIEIVSLPAQVLHYSTKVVGHLVPNRALPQHIMLG